MQKWINILLAHVSAEYNQLNNIKLLFDPLKPKIDGMNCKDIIYRLLKIENIEDVKDTDIDSFIKQLNDVGLNI